MSVTAARGFRASGITAGLKASGTRDVALVVNDGPGQAAAGVFTRNRLPAACVPWTRQALRDGRLAAVVLNSGGANAYSGPQGFTDVHETAERVGSALGVSAADVAVCQTGIIGHRLPMHLFLPGIDRAAGALAHDGGPDAADAIRTTDSVSKQAVRSQGGWIVGGMAKGAGMLAPSLATMLVTLTTDAVADAAVLDRVLRQATAVTFDRIDADGCMSTNDAVLLLASGASGNAPAEADLAAAVTAVCADLAGQLLDDAEGASKKVAVTVGAAASETDALEVARAIARNNLLKCALAGADANWGRVVAAVGTTAADLGDGAIDVGFNGTWVCLGGAPAADPESVDLSGRDVTIEVLLHAGGSSATVWTTDLTEAYVHENSAYST